MKSKAFPPALVLWFGLWMTSGQAQDLTTLPLEVVDQPNMPDELPVVGGLKSLRVPKEMKDYDGYAFMETTVTILDDNKLGLWNFTATHPYLERDVFSQSFSKLTAGKRQGKPVVSTARIMTIFNPASAPASGDTAKPRLLKVVPLYYDFKADLSRIRVRLQISAAGAVVKVDVPPSLPATLQQAAEAVVKEWKLAPAREHGQPVAATIEAPLFLRGKQASIKAEFKPPVPKRTVPVQYPLNMKMSGLEGKVLVQFAVDETGRVRQLFVVSSDNPGFDAAALEAVRQWTFKPATLDNVPVASNEMQLPVVFSIDSGGRSAFTTRYSKRDLADLPPEFQFDTPPELVNIMPVVYPYPALLEKARGEVDAKFVVGPAGLVIKTQVVSATRPDFAEAVKAALNTLKFKPALKKGNPCMAIMRMKFKFHEADGDASLDGDALTLLKQLRAEKLQVIPANELDGKLRPISQRPPYFPLDMKVDSGRAEIEFLIDETGLARFPRVIDASAPEFGYAACQTIATWRFEPPTKNGEEVITRVRVPVIFESK